VSVPGGADVGAFSTSITIPPYPIMTSPAPDGPGNTVTRADGLKVTWTGGANTIIEIDGTSATDNSFSIGASFQCLADGNAGSFTIPPSVLMAMPAGQFANMDFRPAPLPVVFNAKGLVVSFLSAQGDSFALLNLK
jgi:hypothetical protein